MKAEKFLHEIIAGNVDPMTIKALLLSMLLFYLCNMTIKTPRAPYIVNQSAAYQWKASFSVPHICSHIGSQR